MLRRFYTVMVVPHEGGELKRLSISQNFVVSMTVVFLVGVIGSVSLARVFLDGLHQLDESETLKVDNERLAAENARVRSDLHRVVVKLEDLTERLEDYSQVDNGWMPGLEAMGGALPEEVDQPAFGRRLLEGTGDWHASARAAHDKANFWVRMLEDQICDRNEFLRSLPSVWPTHGRLTSGFGWRRDPMRRGRTSQFHKGLDIAAPHGTDVFASADGEVVFASRNGGYGKVVRIDHGNGFVTMYAHLRRINVAIGEKVERGQVIGEVGSTGRSTGPHLHYEVHEAGEPVDPKKYLLAH